MGRFKEAAIETSAALKLNPSPLPIEYIGLAQIYDALGDQARAKTALDRARSLPGGEELTQLIWAQMELKAGHRAGAEKNAARPGGALSR